MTTKDRRSAGRRRGGAPWLVPLVLVLLAAVARAEGEEGAPETAADSALPRSFDFGQARQRDDADGRSELVVVFLGNVWIEGKDFTMRADRIVMWCDPSIRERAEFFSALGGGADAGGGEEKSKEPLPTTAEAWLGPLIRSVYADGDVFFRDDATGTSFEGQRLFFDFEAHRGLVHEARATFTTKETALLGGRSVVLTAHRIRQVARRKFIGEDASITTCDFDEPHVVIRTERTEIEEDEETLTWWHDSDNVRLELGGVPVLWVPGLSGEVTSGRPLRPFESGTVNRSSRFGFTIETLWGDTIGQRRGDHVDWHVHLDGRWRRGFGAGLDLEYELGGGATFGTLRSSYQRDDARTDDITGLAVPRRDRWRIWLQHRFELDARWTLDLETHLISDGVYRLEYYEQEAKEDKLAETYMQLAYRGDGIGFWGLGRVKSNSWATRTESYPRLSATVFSYPLTRAFLGVTDWAVTSDVDVSVAAQRRLGSASLGAHRTTVGRADARVGFRAPVPIGPVRFTPFVAARGTLYSRTRTDRDPEDRTFFEAGSRLDLTLSRTWSDVRSAVLALDGLRHVVNVDVEYFWRGRMSVEPENLFFNDAIDALDEMERFTLRWRNRFQTRRGKNRATVDALDLEIEVDVYPRRSTVRGERVFGLAFLEGRLAAPLSRDVTLVADADYAVDGDELLSESVGIEYRPERRVAAYLGQHYVDNRGHRIGSWVEIRPSVRWGVRLEAAYDIRKNDLRRSSFSLQRFFHDFVLSMDFSVNRDVDDVRFGLSVTPAGLWPGPTPGDGR